jgi:hypothetical protein
MKRVSNPMRYVAAWYAMPRYAEGASSDIKLQKFKAIGNSACGFTKRLASPALTRSRAHMLGHDLPPM